MGQSQGKVKKGDKIKKTLSGHETLVESIPDDPHAGSDSEGEEEDAQDYTDGPGQKTKTCVVDMVNDFIEDLQELDLPPPANGYGDHDDDDTSLQCEDTPVIQSKSDNEDRPSPSQRRLSTPRKVKTSAMAAGEGGLEGEVEGSLQQAIDEAALAVKQQNFFSKEEGEVEEDEKPKENEGTPKKKRYKAKRSQSRMKRFFSRTNTMKVAPIDNLSGHDKVIELKRSNLNRTPSYIFDIAIIPPPPEFVDGELTTEDNQEIYKWLVSEQLTPVPASQFPVHQPEAEYISVTQLYNSMSDGQKSCYLYDPTFLLIIDTRPIKLYRVGHINTAYHISELLENPEVFNPVSEYTLVLLYDNDGRSYSLTNSVISEAMDELVSRKADAYVLEGGYDAFHLKFPFYCTTKTPTTERERQLLVPNSPSVIIEDRLYLGQAGQAHKESTIRNLQITHIVSVTHEKNKPFEDFVEYHHIHLVDEPESGIHKYFADAIAFMGEAIDNGGKVLVHCNLGQSRSSTLVISYLIFTRKWTLHDAYSFVKEQRPVVHPNEGFMNQLSNFEKALFGKRVTNIELYGYKVITVTKNSSDSDAFEMSESGGAASINEKVKKLISKKKKTKYTALDDTGDISDSELNDQSNIQSDDSFAKSQSENESKEKGNISSNEDNIDSPRSMSNRNSPRKVEVLGNGDASYKSTDGSKGKGYQPLCQDTIEEMDNGSESSFLISDNKEMNGGKDKTNTKHLEGTKYLQTTSFINLEPENDYVDTLEGFDKGVVVITSDDNIQGDDDNIDDNNIENNDFDDEYIDNNDDQLNIISNTKHEVLNEERDLTTSKTSPSKTKAILSSPKRSANRDDDISLISSEDRFNEDMPIEDSKCVNRLSINGGISNIAHDDNVEGLVEGEGEIRCITVKGFSNDDRNVEGDDNRLRNDDEFDDYDELTEITPL